MDIIIMPGGGINLDSNRIGVKMAGLTMAYHWKSILQDKEGLKSSYPGDFLVMDTPMSKLVSRTGK